MDNEKIVALLIELNGHVVETKTLVSGMGERLDDVEEDVGKLKTDRTRLFAYYAAACVVVPMVLWVLGVFKAGASAL